MPAHPAMPSNEGAVIQKIDPPVFVANFPQSRVDAVHGGKLSIAGLEFEDSSASQWFFERVNDQGGFAAAPKCANPDRERFSHAVDGRPDFRRRETRISLPDFG